jgi:hypothetical protein
VTPPRLAPYLACAVPEGWVETALSPPDLSRTVGVRLLAWSAWRPPPFAGGSAGELVVGCLGGNPGTWSAEAEPLVFRYLHALVGSTVLRVARPGPSASAGTSLGEFRVASTTREGNVTRERLEGTGDAEGALTGQVFLGFTPSATAITSASRDAEPTEQANLVGCFALCTGAQAGCEESVVAATASHDFVAPPPPSLSLRAVLGMIHHPTATLAWTLALSLLVGFVLVTTRRRPRTK